jgi:DNA ligase (NAD+)
MDNRLRYNELKKLIKYHMDKYYNQDDSEISDYEYDMLVLELKKIENEYPELITKDSPTQIVGETVKREFGVKVTHNVPMLSIPDVFTKEDVIKWIHDVRNIHKDAKFSVEHKIDGLSMSIRYENGELKQAGTRGTGFVGDDVTINSYEIKGIMKSIDIKSSHLELRCEVYMSHEDFEKTNEKQELMNKKLFANPRNCAAGTLKNLNPEITKERGLKLFVFNVQDGPAELMKNHTFSLDKLASIGIPVVPHKLCVTDEEVLAEIDAIGESRGVLDYDIDGAVVKIEQVEYRNDFSAGSKYSSGHIAYKYPPEEKEAIITNIELSVGRTGKISPTAVFTATDSNKPIHLCGTNVSRATLHNQDFINELGVGIGDTVVVFKSGEIIPKIKAVIKHVGNVFKIPNTCPDCGQPVVREIDTADIKCVNTSCPSQLIRTVSYFAGRDAMDIKNFGETYIKTLVEVGYINSYADIYKLKKYREELVVKGIIGKDKNTDKILEAIEKSKNNDVVNLLTGLGIQNVGKASAKEIMKKFSSISELSVATEEDLVAIQDVGEVTAKCIIEFFANKANKEIINALEAEGVNMNSTKIEGSTTKLSGMIFCITGSLPSMDRKEVESIIELNGGKCTGSVSKKTNYLLAGEAAGSKLEKAKTLGVSIISEEDFLNMINN